MKSFVCPNCGTQIEIDQGMYSTLLSQVRDDAFRSEVDEKVKAEVENARLQEAERNSAQIAEFKESIALLNGALDKADTEKELAVKQAQVACANQINELKLALASANSEKDSEISALRAKADEAEKSHSRELAEKEELIAYYRDLKARQSTKMIGETLEQHCQMTFDMYRSSAFQGAYFEKDSDISDGTKGDYIFREYDENGEEYISIMFEMKNEMDTTEKKRKNEEFFKKLDSDRTKKGCEYAVLVSMLEADNDYYNQGIVDVSHRFSKMYVIRPQFLIPFITMLRNEARNSLGYRHQLAEVRNQNLDIERFGEALGEFKDKFTRDCDLATKQHNEAIEQIERAIKTLEKVRNDLLSSSNHIRLANDKVEDLSMKRLCKNSPGLLAAYEDAMNE